MQISISNNPIAKLSCYLHNKKEDLSQLYWINGKRKKVECRICGRVLDSWKDKYSPMQCGWHKVDKYNNWICHRCFDHRDFSPFIDMIDEENNKWWEEHHKVKERIELKAQEVLDLLKEYLLEYKDILDLYRLWDLECDYEDGHMENDFSINIEDKNEEYELRIRNDCITKVSLKDKKVIEITNYIDEEKIRNFSFAESWTWDDAIEVIKSRLEKRKQ